MTREAAAQNIGGPVKMVEPVAVNEVVNGGRLDYSADRADY